MLTKKILKSNNKILKVKFYLNFYGRYKFSKEINSIETLCKAKFNKFKNSWFLVPENINDYLICLETIWSYLLRIREKHILLLKLK